MSSQGFADMYSSDFFAGWEKVTATRKPWIAAVEAFAQRKFGPGGPYHPDTPGAWTESSAIRASAGALLHLRCIVRTAKPADVTDLATDVLSHRLVLTYDDQPFYTVSIMEFGDDGKVSRETQYFCDPFPASEWRSQWVEQM